MAGVASRENGKKGGRPKGSGDKPHIRDYWTPEQVEEFYLGLFERAKTNDRLAVFCAEQLSGKATQTVETPGLESALKLMFDPVFKQDATS